MVSNLYTGAEIFKAADGGFMIIPDRKKKNGKGIIKGQSGKEVVNAIDEKYGCIYKTGLYYHRGKGEWTEYSKKTDASRWHGKDRKVQKGNGVMGKVSKISADEKNDRRRHLGDAYAKDKFDFKRGRGRGTYIHL